MWLVGSTSISLRNARISSANSSLSSSVATEESSIFFLHRFEGNQAFVSLVTKIVRYCLGGIYGIYGPDGSLVVSRAQIIVG